MNRAASPPIASDARQDLLRRMLAREGLTSVGNAPIPRRPPGHTQLSFGQERLWFLDQLNPSGAAYNIHHALRFDAKLDTGALTRALNTVVARHEVLRTTFQRIDNRLVQVVAPALELGIPIVDLRSDGAAAERRAEGLATAEARRPFDLATGPLLRMLAIQVQAARWIVVLTIHHIIADAWSLRVLLDELGRCYTAATTGRHISLPPLTLQYGDLAHWQRQGLASGAADQDLRALQDRLTGLPVLELPTDRPRPPNQTFAGGVRTFELNAQVTGQLRDMAAREDTTLFTSLLTGFAALMARYSGQEDFPIATFSAGRDRPEVEPMIGFLVNTLVLRLDLRGDPTFTQALGRVRAVALDAFACQHVPFERLVELLAPTRDLSRNPLVQVAFQHFGRLPAAASGIAMPETLNVERGAAVFDLVVSSSEQADGSLVGRVEFNLDLFDAATIERMIGHYLTLLTLVPLSPVARLSDLVTPSPEERALMAQWNDTDCPFPDKGLAALFKMQVQRTPDAAALVMEGAADVSYAALDTAAEALAPHLRQAGVGPEKIVGLCAERSTDLMIGLFAILKAGGAYLPLDPDSPSDRLAMILDEALPQVILAQGAMVPLLPKTAKVIVLDVPLPAVADEATPVIDPDTAGLSYVIFTSGSTGTPKGAMNTTRGIVNRLNWMQKRYPLAPDDRVMLKTPISFDVSVWELIWPLLAGAAVAIARPGGHREPHYLAQFIERHGVTTLHFVPSMLRAFLQEPDLDRCRTLRRVICSGEALPPDLQALLFERLPWVELHNLYGPTEAAIDVTSWQCRPEDGLPFVPIGRPIDNMQCHILDQRLMPLPIGIPGELCISGVGLARGYLNRPELTAQRFVRDPVQPDRVMYRTGDRARWRAQGHLDYLGRLDTQVKIRGVRIETGEVEAALSALKFVAGAAVVARPYAAGSLQLVAYVIPKHGATVSVEILRAALRNRLPEPFLPTALVLLDQFPLTSSGKLDRRALPPPTAEVAAGAVAPRNDLDAALVEIWSEVLGRKGLSIHDNFFELGGHSLLATQVVARIRNRLAVDLPLRNIFEFPTIAGLSGSMADLAPAVPGDEIQPLERRSGDLSRFMDELSDDDIEIALQLALEQQGGSA